MNTIELIEAARRASRFTADVADQALADLKAAEKQIEQLRKALQELLHCPAIHDVYGDDKDEETHEAERIARKAQEETK